MEFTIYQNLGLSHVLMSKHYIHFLEAFVAFFLKKNQAIIGSDCGN